MQWTVYRKKDRVKLSENREGIVRWKGSLKGEKGTYYGVELTKGKGNTNGTYNNRQYFVCGDMRGVFVPYTDILEKLRSTTLSNIDINDKRATSTTRMPRVKNLSAHDHDDDDKSDDDEQAEEKKHEEKTQLRPTMKPMQILQPDEFVALHNFSVEQVSDMLTIAVHQNEQYQQELHQTLDVVRAECLAPNGLNWETLKQKLAVFINHETLDILFEAQDSMQEYATMHGLLAANNIALSLLESPLQRLQVYLADHQIDGKKLIEMFNKKETRGFIGKITGWSLPRQRQLESVWLRYFVLPKDEFHAKLDSLLNARHDIPDEVKDKVRKSMLEIDMDIDVEELQYRVRNNGDISTFQEKMHTLIDEVAIAEQMDDDAIWRVLFECFVIPQQFMVSFWIGHECKDETLSVLPSRYRSQSKQRDMYLSCHLCGVSQIECISAKIKNDQVNLNEHDHEYEYENDGESQMIASLLLQITEKEEENTSLRQQIESQTQQIESQTHQIEEVTQKYERLRGSVDSQEMEEQRQSFLAARKKINEGMLEFFNTANVPLHKYTTQQIHDVIEWWFYNDMKYVAELRKCMHIMAEHELSGEAICARPFETTKLIIKAKLSSFISAKTMQLIIDWLHELKTKKEEELQKYSAVYVGRMVHEYALNALLKVIENEQIDGEKFLEISRFETKKNFIQEATGWKRGEAEQIKLMLLKHVTMREHEIKANVLNVKVEIGDEKVSDRVQQCLSNVADLETLHYKLKNNRSVQEFGEQVSEMVNKIYTDSQYDDHKYEQLVVAIYQCVANVFVVREDEKDVDKHEEDEKEMKVDEQNEDDDNDDDATKMSRVNDAVFQAKKAWKCSLCGNDNFCRMMAHKISVDLSCCSLCGTKQTDSIIATLKNSPTYISGQDDEASDHVQNDDEEKTDEMDKSIEQYLADHDKQHFNLSCPARSDSQRCPHLISLAKTLVKYNKWCDSASRDFADITEQDVAQSVDDELFKTMIMENINTITYAKFTEDLKDKVMNVLDANKGKMSEIKTFLSFKNKQEFAAALIECTGIKAKFFKLVGPKLYDRLYQRLRMHAQRERCGEYLANLEMNAVQIAFQHLVQIHVNNGNKTSISNLFGFYNGFIHLDDDFDDIAKFKSYQRHKARHRQQQQQHVQEDKKPTDIDIWKLKEENKQSQLDKMHTFLAHNDYHRFLPTYSESSHHDDDEKEDEDASIINQHEIEAMSGRQKFKSAHYGFGLDHHHPYLSATYDSMYDELTRNTLCVITEQTFYDILMKAISVRASRNKDRCKHYKSEYGIIRNERMGLRHMFALILYTDLSDFCTSFRSTYRKLDEDASLKDTEKRAKQYYYCCPSVV